MILKSGEFQYYYSLWFENTYGQVIPIKTPLEWEPKRPLTHKVFTFFLSQLLFFHYSYFLVL